MGEVKQIWKTLTQENSQRFKIKGRLIKIKILADVMEQVVKKNPNETEFHQAVNEVLESLEPVAAKHPEWVKAGLFDQFVEPERQIVFLSLIHISEPTRLGMISY